MPSIRALHLLCLALATTAVAGCYAPDLRDCTVTCTAGTDCASGQVCGRDGFCASADVAGQCDRLGDAGVRPDAPPPPPAKITLHVQIDGPGRVTIAGVGVCSKDVANGDCTWQVAPGALTAVPEAFEDKHFEHWTTPPCSAMPTATPCAFTLAAPITVGAKFK